MKTKLTVIVDNLPQGQIRGEWGLSILAGHAGKKVLIDTGASDLFAKNMRALGLSLADVDYAVLSHAHYDHANGMLRFFQENRFTCGREPPPTATPGSPSFGNTSGFRGRS